MYSFFKVTVFLGWKIVAAAFDQMNEREGGAGAWWWAPLIDYIYSSIIFLPFSITVVYPFREYLGFEPFRILKTVVQQSLKRKIDTQKQVMYT